MKCRFCEHQLEHTFVDLVSSPPANSFLTQQNLLEPEMYFPLRLFTCDNCFLVQIDEYKKAQEIFSSDYVYFSSYSKSWLAHAKKYTEHMISRFGFNEQSFIMEIASNDGYLLQYFKEKHIPVLGIEPTLNTAEVARLKGILTISDYFGESLANKLLIENMTADLLIGNNVLAHVPDINDFVAGLKIVLKEQGIITMEFPHLLKLIEHVEFDTIYHEHFSYLSFNTVSKIFASHGLEMFDVQEITTHGGSLRIFAKHFEDKSKSISPSVELLLNKEKEAGITTSAYYDDFQQKVDMIKYNFLDFVLLQRKNNKKVIAYGAAAKGNTFLNYCGIKGDDLIQFVVDASPYKQNKFLPGSHLPVYSEERIKEYKPDYIIILAWNLKDEIMEQLSYIREWNGKFVMCIPQMKIL
ncbi:class I SAM-dependent methyltransferase [Rhodocytophaga rosea]|uniref:Class I SAM-dependent methyltransferase n=1 Tax=Rhodocytophaga rosea TaxID=2704465 RepID=A0A6C0GQ53_9BACT|nr:class I SAM-dependent methyltransferase [Rhodocytophaga rosea]QHT70205.1 class I SAM-dependent methyltransferase [Rhodocytophaga rosea]